MKYGLIQRERGVRSVERACGLLKVSPSGFYAWQQRQAQDEPMSDERPLVAEIIRIFEESHRTYGSPGITAALRQQGIGSNHKRVARLMRQHHLVARDRQRRRVRTTDSRHGFPIAPNRLKRQFSAQPPNEKWGADFTYVHTSDGWRYLALVLDVFSRKIVGWAMEKQMDATLVEQALRLALSRRQPTAGERLPHSDRGSQDASLPYQDLLAAHHLTVSMSRTADPYDNALRESCIGPLKTECADPVSPSPAIARSELFAYLEGWYNRKRLHSSLGYLSPDQFEQWHLQDKLLLHPEG
jgi:putative transposase